MNTLKNLLFLFLGTFLVNACGFHPQGEVHLAPPLKNMYLQASDPYSETAKALKQYLQASHVQLVDTPAQANTRLIILSNTSTQTLLSVNATQQTRSYLLLCTLVFEISGQAGNILVAPQTLVESRVITVQSNVILGSSNEVTTYYKQMYREIAYAVINRIASIEITKMVKSPANNDKQE